MDKNNENDSKESEEILKLKHQLTTANIMIKQLKDKLESNSITRTQLEQHVQELNRQINELLRKIKSSNMKHSKNEEKIATLHSSISSFEHVSYFLFNLNYVLLNII